MHDIQLISANFGYTLNYSCMVSGVSETTHDECFDSLREMGTPVLRVAHMQCAILAGNILLMFVDEIYTLPVFAACSTSPGGC